MEKNNKSKMDLSKFFKRNKFSVIYPKKRRCEKSSPQILNNEIIPIQKYLKDKNAKHYKNKLKKYFSEFKEFKVQIQNHRQKFPNLIKEKENKKILIRKKKESININNIHNDNNNVGISLNNYSLIQKIPSFKLCSDSHKKLSFKFKKLELENKFDKTISRTYQLMEKFKKRNFQKRSEIIKSILNIQSINNPQPLSKNDNINNFKKELTRKNLQKIFFFNIKRNLIESVVRILKEFPEYLNSNNDHNQRPISITVGRNYFVLTKILLTLNCDVNFLIDEKFKIIDLALKNNNYEMAELLLAHGADPFFTCPIDSTKDQKLITLLNNIQNIWTNYPIEKRKIINDAYFSKKKFFYSHLEMENLKCLQKI
jgi:hypothetical protein